MFSWTQTDSQGRRKVSGKELLWQAALVLAVTSIIGIAVWNAAENLARQRIASGFGFLQQTAGFDISQSLISFDALSTYGRAFVVGLLNTLEVSLIAIPLATILGFTIGIFRRSPNWLLSRLAAAYVEIFRNTPLLLQLLFWYNAVLMLLPAKASESLQLGDLLYLNRRGLSVPKPLVGDNTLLCGGIIALSVLLVVLTIHWARTRRYRTGRSFPTISLSLLIFVCMPAVLGMLVTWTTGQALLHLELPRPGRFSVEGGWQLLPEFVALLIGLVVYTASSIAEVVRSGLAAVPRGQYEAARALHLPSVKILRVVVVPQAIRIIIPPLTNQYLNLLKNSSLAVAIGYPDLVQVFAGTVLNQTGQAVEIVLMTMAVYLTLSLLTSAGMNVYNRRVALVER